MTDEKRHRSIDQRVVAEIDPRHSTGTSHRLRTAVIEAVRSTNLLLLVSSNDPSQWISSNISVCESLLAHPDSAVRVQAASWLDELQVVAKTNFVLRAMYGISGNEPFDLNHFPPLG